jgi:hypothetical protein
MALKGQETIMKALLLALLQSQQRHQVRRSPQAR